MEKNDPRCFAVAGALGSLARIRAWGRTEQSYVVIVAAIIVVVVVSG